MDDDLFSACDLLLDRTTLSVWKKGEEYERQKKVTLVTFDDRHVSAKAQGTSLYSVELRFRGGGISKKCTCPYSYEKTSRQPPCKHIIATAILWDEARGFARPTPRSVEECTIPPPLITRAQLAKAYDDPLCADLEILRLASDEFSLSPRPHARLPAMPEFIVDATLPLDPASVTSAFSSIRSWSRRRHYDSYFCAGEMVAAFCEVLRCVLKRARVTPPLVLAEILLKCAQFHTEMIYELIDDSEGEHIFGDAHIDELYRVLVMRDDVPLSQKKRFDSLLKQSRLVQEE